MKNFTKLLIVIVSLLVIPFKGFSQTDSHHEHKDAHGHEIDKFSLPLEFDADSLTGFHEEAAWQQAIMNHEEMWQQKRFVAVLKRNYINFRFGLSKAASSNPTVQAPCSNPDFETGTLAGWNAVQSPNNNSQTMLPFTAGATANIIVVPPGPDPNGLPITQVSPGGGSFAARLGTTGASSGGYSYRLSQTFTVTAANSVFIYKYAVALNKAPHSCTEQPFFNITFADCSNNPIPCGAYAVTAIGSGCGSGDPSFQTSGQWAYKDWTTRSFDLTPYIGQCVKIEFTVGGCVITQGAHGGYAYVDCSCQPMTLNLNGTDIPVGQTTTNMCVAATNTLCAPLGFTSYLWDGPGGATGQATRCITSSTAGTFSVTLGMQGTSCQNPVLYSTFNYVPKPTANFNFTTTPCQNTFTVPFADNSTLNGGPAISNYYWDFDNNGTTDNLTQNPTNTYTASGSYSVELKVSNGGCTDSITKVINLTPLPIANFNTSNACLNSAINFTSTATPTVGIASHAWDFGDGSANGSGLNPAHTYTSSGIFNVTYTVTNTDLCQSVISKTVVISPNPIISAGSNTVCLNLTTVFTNSSSVAAPDNITTWAWDFDNNGTTDNAAQFPTNTFTTVGTHTVELKAITSSGCRDSTTISVQVNAIQTANFTASNACSNSPINIVNNTTVAPPDYITAYNWDFGVGANPATGSGFNPTLPSYSSSGTKTITLNISSNTTCTANLVQTIQIYAQPVANFSTTSVCQSTGTAFTDMSTPTGSITGWAWDFTNNGSIDNTTNAPTNIFLSSGTFSTALIVTSSNNCKDTVILPVNVWGHTIPNFTPDKVCYGASSLFTNLTDETTNANVGSGTTYLWNFADGSSTSTLNGPSHTYTLGGNANSVYNVTLTATSLHNCADSIVKVVNVYAVPSASFTSDSVCLGLASHMTDASNGNGNAVNVYVWDFLSDGTVDASGVVNPNFTFPAYGNNNVTYTVSTSPVAGLICSNTNNTIKVWVNPNPIPNFTFVNKCINAQPNTFDGLPSSIAIGSNTSYLWAYGDGTVSTPTLASASTHTYLAAGVYNTTLTVTSNKGCQTAIAKQVTVYQKPLMNIANSSACDKAAMSFTAISMPNSGVVANWSWDFNNTLVSAEGTGQTTNFIFAAPGAHTIALISETSISAGGCRDTSFKQIYVNYVPVPLFTVDKQQGCPIHCVVFSDATQPIPGPSQVNQWQWTLGDGSALVNNSTNANVNHCYLNNSSNQSALYDVNLLLITDSGCVNSINKISYITVYPKPIANYSVNPNPGNVVTPLEYFTNQSQDYTKWWWLFGDNSPKDSVNIDPTHFYSEISADTYYSVLLVANQYGCMDTAYVPVEIGPEFTFYIPNAFTPLNNDGINDYFTGTGIGIAQYEMWIFDRWGAMIFYTDDIQNGWNGKVQGKTPEGKQDVYTWKVKLKDVLGKNHDYIGHVTLLNLIKN